MRGAAPLRLEIALAPGCATRFDVLPDGEEASANGSYVVVSSPLAARLADDSDLAALLAHEIAHNILRHPQLLERRARGLLPGFGKSGRIMRATELAADRLSMYLLALAGFDPARAIPFWQRFGRRHDWGILSDRTHPAWSDRIATMREEIAHIDVLKLRREPIRPPVSLLPATNVDSRRAQQR
jgi:predicted Zn-dependent protease